MTFVQNLENRVLLSASTVTAAMLAADKATVVADSTTLKADAKAAFGNDKVDTKFVAAAFAALPKSEQTLLKPFEAAATKSTTVVSADVAGLLNASNALVNKSTAAGTAVLKKATAGSLNALLKDITQLDLITAQPVSKLTSALSSTDLSSVAALINAAFPADSAIINAVLSQVTAAQTGNSTILNDATKYQTDIGTLAADLTTVHNDLATYPALVGTFTGTASETAGPNKGQTVTSTLTISTEDNNTGKVTGTVTDESTGGTDSVSGTVSLNGAIALTSIPSTGPKGTLSGFVVGSTVVGKFKLGKASGLFSLTEIVT